MKPRNHDMRYRDLIATVRSRYNLGPLITACIGNFGDRDLVLTRTLQQDIPNSRYAKSRKRLSHKTCGHNSWSWEEKVKAQIKSISEFQRSRCESVETLGQRNAEMPKPDLKGKNNKDYPTVRIKIECDRRVTILSHTLTLQLRIC
jgi:hypothetical protein